jgi:23S rRNA (uracil1939-C5)-methyltransferase
MPFQTVTIEKLVPGGAGLARTPDGVVFVNDVAPGETVEIEITEKKRGTAFARAIKVLKPSPSRRAPPCPLFGKCGGCDWLHIGYTTQVQCKKEMLIDCMRRIGRLENLPEIETFAAQEFGYRCRAQFKINALGRAGFFARRSNEVVPVRRCPLLVDPLNALLAGIEDKKISLPRPLKNLMTVAGDNGTVASSPTIAGATDEKVLITAGNKKFEVSGNGFFQSNALLLELLGTWAKAKVNGDRCVELYGGGGFFSVMLAERFREGMLVESVGAEAAAAGVNFTRNGINHFSAMEGTAEDLLRLAGTKPMDCLIVDPPRTGLSPEVRDGVAALKPAMILYVSCDPSTQARDAGFLVNNAGYSISAAALFDLYPDTHHMESLLTFKKGP